MTVIAERCIQVLDLLFRHSELIDGGDYKDIGCLFTDATVAFELPDGATSELVAAQRYRPTATRTAGGSMTTARRTPGTRSRTRSLPSTRPWTRRGAVSTEPSFHEPTNSTTSGGRHRYEDEPRRIDGSWRTGRSGSSVIWPGRGAAAAAAIECLGGFSMAPCRPGCSRVTGAFEVR